MKKNYKAIAVPNKQTKPEHFVDHTLGTIYCKSKKSYPFYYSYCDVCLRSLVYLYLVSTEHIMNFGRDFMDSVSKKSLPFSNSESLYRNGHDFLGIQ